MNCRKCKSKNVSFTKHIHRGKGKPTYHYKQWCYDCGRVSTIPRTQEIYEIVKTQQWIEGNKTSFKIRKAFKKEIDNKKTLFITLHSLKKVK